MLVFIAAADAGQPNPLFRRAGKWSKFEEGRLDGARLLFGDLDRPLITVTAFD